VRAVDEAELVMGMERHEVPTMFVHGHTAPADVQYVEETLCAALLCSPAVRYSIVWIEAAALPVSVEIEAGVSTGTIDARREGTSVRNAGDACVAALVRSLAPAFVENGA
jgi:hypothetical protein